MFEGPAIGLMIVGIINSLAIRRHRRHPWRYAFHAKRMGFAILPFVIAGTVIGMIGILQVLGGLRMRRLKWYGLAIAASILAIIISPGNLIGLPIGIWALVVLSQRDVRSRVSENRACHWLCQCCATRRWRMPCHACTKHWRSQ